MLIIIIIGIALLAYFKVDVRGFVDSPFVHSTLVLMKKYSLYVWEHILKTPSLYIYNDIVLVYVWPTLERLFDTVKDKVIESTTKT